MGWDACKRRYTNPILDEAHLAQALGIPRDEVSERLHAIKRTAGLKGKSVFICLDDGEVYMPTPPYDPIGNLLD